MHTKTQRLVLQGGLILLGSLVISSIGGWARRATADDQPTAVTAPALLGELRPVARSKPRAASSQSRACSSSAPTRSSTTPPLQHRRRSGRRDLRCRAVGGRGPRSPFRLVKTGRFSRTREGKAGL
jgi:hypothetical protein